MTKDTDKKLYSWNLELLFKGDNDPEIESKLTEAKEKSYEFINKWKDRDDYLNNPEILKKALDEYEIWSRNYGTDGDAGYYFWLKSMLDQTDTTIKARLNKIIETAQKIENDIQFFTIRISKIDSSKQGEFLNSLHLQPYRHFLEKLFTSSKYILSEPEEKILNLKSKTSYSNWVQMTSTLLSKEEREVLTDSNKKEVKTFNEILNLTDNQNQLVRDDAARALNEILDRWVDVGENEINSILENKKISDELRGYSRPDEARHIGDDIETEVVDALVDSVSSRYDITQRYYKFKAKLLGKEKLAYHERNLTYGEVSEEYSYEDAVNLVKKVFSNLHPKFREIVDSFVEEGRIDVYPKKGKYNGAFCTHGDVNLPIYILLNYNSKLNDVLTLAHELGHGINHTLMKKQNAINYGSPTSTAEVTSTFMEDFVLQEIIRDADDELKLSLLMMKLNEEVSTIIRQPAIYKFEQDLHQKFTEVGYLSKEQIGEIFAKNMQAYMGEGVDQTPGSQNWWLFISHIRQFFYVYSYSSGLLISKALQSFVKKEPAFIDKVIEFFEAGESDSPKNIFLKLGVDITEKEFWDKGLEEISGLLDEAENLAKKLGKI